MYTRRLNNMLIPVRRLDCSGQVIEEVGRLYHSSTRGRVRGLQTG